MISVNAAGFDPPLFTIGVHSAIIGMAEIDCAFTDEPMPSLAYNLGRIASRYARRVKWIAAELAGTEAERIRTEEELGRELAARFDPAVEADPDRQVAAGGAGRQARFARGQASATIPLPIAAGKGEQRLALPGGYVDLTQALVEFLFAG